MFLVPALTIIGYQSLEHIGGVKLFGPKHIEVEGKLGFTLMIMTALSILGTLCHFVYNEVKKRHNKAI